MRNVDYLIMLERRENIIVKKTEDFGDRIIKLHKYLLGKREGNVDILKQILRSGTSIGANVSEGYLTDTEYKSIIKDNEEIINILVKITGTMKQRMQK